MPKSNSTWKRKLGKLPEGFPLTARCDGRFQRKIRGETYYFGRDFDWKLALDEYKLVAEDLQAGRRPRKLNGDSDGLTVIKLCNHFRAAKKQACMAGELSPRTLRDYTFTLERVLKVFGKHRLVEDLAADDFAELAAVMSKTLGVNARKTEIQKTRCMFRYAYETGLVKNPIRFGPSFKTPPKAAIRRQRNAGPLRMFEAEELRKLLAVLQPQHKAMTLLGVNAGFGNSDVATLPLDALDLDGGWITYPRPKTGVERKAKLWVETVWALREHLKTRVKPNDPADQGLVFITKNGRKWIELRDRVWFDSVGLNFRKLLTRAGVARPGLSFYSLRRTCETIGGGCRDQIAVDHVMGHADQSMAGIYRQWVEDERIEEVCEHIRRWLWPAEDKSGKTKQ